MRIWVGTVDRRCHKCFVERSFAKYFDDDGGIEYFVYVCIHCQAVMTEKIPFQKPAPPDKNDPTTPSIFDRLSQDNDKDNPGS